jgi:hypothetical protein
MIYYKLFITGSITGGVMGAGSLQPSIGAEVGRRYIMLVVHTSCNNSEICRVVIDCRPTSDVVWFFKIGAQNSKFKPVCCCVGLQSKFNRTKSWN